MTKAMTTLGRGILGHGILGLAALAALAGCSSGSISDSDGRSLGGQSLYQGELSAYEILGVNPRAPISDTDIQRARMPRHPLELAKNAPILLIQSGALFADDEMMRAMATHYTVSTFSGVPLSQRDRTDAPPSYAQLFRLAAARGGIGTVVVYWGIVETTQETLGTSPLSWVPLIGGSIPDQSRHMRVRVMMSVIDVATGQSDTFTNTPVEDDIVSSAHDRDSSAAALITALKTRAYQSAADTLASRYGAAASPAEAPRAS